MMRAQRPVLTAQNPSAYSQIPALVLVPRACSGHSAVVSSPVLSRR